MPRLSCLPAPRPLKTSPRKREPTYRLTRARARTGRLAGSSFDGAAHTWRQRLWGAGPRGTGCGWCGCWSVEGPGRFKFTAARPLQRTRPRRCAHRQPATVRRANYVNRPPRPCRLWRRVVLHPAKSIVVEVCRLCVGGATLRHGAAAVFAPCWWRARGGCQWQRATACAPSSAAASRCRGWRAARRGLAGRGRAVSS